MPTIEERIKEIEEEIKKTEYNKATEHHIGILKAKLSKLQLEAESHKKGGRGGFAIPKSGDATVALVGFPNVGKSSILNSLTNTSSEVGNFAFTTLRIIPGTLEYNGALIQILDLPGIIENAAVGSGRGREVLSIVRSADLILIVTDISTEGIQKIISELYRAGIVINRKKKNIAMKRRNSGGIRIYKPKNVLVDNRTIRDIVKEFKVTNAEVYIRENVEAEDIIDFLRGNMVYIPSFAVVNKIDLPHDKKVIDEAVENFDKVIQISASKNIGINELRKEIFDSLNFVRVYLREKSGSVDYQRPLVLTKGARVRDVCRRISREMINSFRYAIMSGPNRKMAELRVGLDYEILDEDVVTIISQN